MPLDTLRTLHKQSQAMEETVSMQPDLKLFQDLRVLDCIGNLNTALGNAIELARSMETQAVA